MLFIFLDPADTTGAIINTVPYETLEWYWCLLILIAFIAVIALLFIGIKYIIRLIAKKSTKGEAI